MKILLTEKEVDAVLEDWGKNPKGRGYDNEVAKAQLKKVVIGLEGVIRASVLADDGWVYTIPASFVEALKKEVE